jgi:hypothetical protein
VIMAIVTTLMTSPLVAVLLKGDRKEEDKPKKHRVLSKV